LVPNVILDVSEAGRTSYQHQVSNPDCSLVQPLAQSLL